MPLTLTASWTTDCVPQTPVSCTQGVGEGVPVTETEEQLEARFSQSVRTAIQATGGADPPGACP